MTRIQGGAKTAALAEALGATSLTCDGKLARAPGMAGIVELAR
jgi:predicted nucleic acid-binding protein